MCRETVTRGDSRWSVRGECGRPAFEDGLCKMHLRVRANREEKARAYAAREQRSADLQEEANRLSRLLGVDVRPDYNPFIRTKTGQGDYTGAMTVPGDWLALVAEHGYVPGEKVTHLLRGDD